MKITRGFLRELQSEAHKQAGRYRANDIRKEYWDKMYNVCLVLLHQDDVYKFENIEEPEPTAHDIMMAERNKKDEWMKRALLQSSKVNA